MKRSLIAATAALCLFGMVESADARNVGTPMRCDDRYMHTCSGRTHESMAEPRFTKRKAAHPRRTFRGHARHHSRVLGGRIVRHSTARAGASLDGLPVALVAKVTEIIQACTGFRVISSFRPGAVVAGTRRPSLHGRHQAADIAGPNYKCAYALLRGWPGGVSVDAHRVRHIHMSWSPKGREWGARFVHGGGHRHGHRSYARHHHHRHYHARRHHHRYYYRSWARA